MMEIGLIFSPMRWLYKSVEDTKYQLLKNIKVCRIKCYINCFILGIYCTDL